VALAVGEKVLIDFEADKLRVECRGDVMRKIPGGYGIRFLSLEAAAKKDIRRMIKKRFPFRHQVNIPGRWSTAGREIAVAILDISNTGCYLKADLEGIVEGQGGELAYSFHSRDRRLQGTVIWLNRKELHEKPIGFGLQFLRNEKKIVGRLVEQLKKDHCAR
jgi:hypothetical protein